MHERASVQAVVDEAAAVVARNGGASASRLRIRIGGSSGIDPEAFRAQFLLLAAGTVLADAELDLRLDHEVETRHVVLESINLIEE